MSKFPHNTISTSHINTANLKNVHRLHLRTSQAVIFLAPHLAAIITSRPVPVPMSNTIGSLFCLMTASTAYCTPLKYASFLSELYRHYLYEQSL